MSEDQPDEILKLGPDEITLIRGTAFVTIEGLGDFPADRMTVQHYTGQKEAVLVFTAEGTRRVARIQPHIVFRTSTSAVPMSSKDEESAQALSDDDQTRLLAMYDLLKNRSFK
jgi:hypothetical protein